MAARGWAAGHSTSCRRALFARVLPSVLLDTSQLAFNLSGQCRSSTEFGFPRNVTAELVFHLAHLVGYSPQLSIHLRFRLPLGHTRVFDRFLVNLQTHLPRVTAKQNRCRSSGTKLSGLTFAIWFSQTVKGGRIEGLDRLRRRNSRDLTGRSGGFECCRPKSHQAAFLLVLQRRPAPRTQGAGPRRPWSRGYIQRATAAARAQGHPCANHAGTGAARGRSLDDHAAVITRRFAGRGSRGAGRGRGAWRGARDGRSRRTPIQSRPRCRLSSRKRRDPHCMCDRFSGRNSWLS